MLATATKLFFLRFDDVQSECDRLSLQLDKVDRAIAGASSGDVDMFYASDSDCAMLVLRIAASSVTRKLSANLRMHAVRMNAELIEISRKTQSSRRRFYQVVMPLYDAGNGDPAS